MTVIWVFINNNFRCSVENDLFLLLGAILRELSHRPITSADVGFKGTQLKLTLILEGGQRVAFKPKRLVPYFCEPKHSSHLVWFETT